MKLVVFFLVLQLLVFMANAHKPQKPHKPHEPHKPHKPHEPEKPTHHKCSPQAHGEICDPEHDVVCDHKFKCIKDVCSCPGTHVYNGKECVPKPYDYKEECDCSDQCDKTKNLICIRKEKKGKKICDCLSSWTYNGTACVSKKVLPKSCKEIKTKDPETPSGIFKLDTSDGPIDAYCEMDIDGGGYTFVPRSAIKANSTVLDEIYKDTKKILFRLLPKTDATKQPYILTTQLAKYDAVAISVQENAHVGYAGLDNTPKNKGIAPFIFIGMLPNTLISKPQTLLGFRSNGKDISFNSCDGNPNSYWALYANLNPANPSKYGSDNGIISKWKSSALPHPEDTSMPNDYFYFAEIHWGGCGGYDQSNRWNDFNGVAAGFR